MKIPMVDLKGQYQTLKQEIDSAIVEALGETRYILGPNVQAFDAKCTEYLGVSHAISCASGTDALQLALHAAGIGTGDEVITSAFTFIATAEAIRYLGAVPVFADIQPHSFNLDPEAVASSITEPLSVSPSVVHHCLMYGDTRGEGRSIDEQTPDPGFSIFGPGADYRGGEPRFLNEAPIAGWASTSGSDPSNRASRPRCSSLPARPST